ncbi:MAG: hypothetical protein ACE5GI_02905 [Candidatus Aminicenantales bacterium]
MRNVSKRGIGLAFIQSKDDYYRIKKKFPEYSGFFYVCFDWLTKEFIKSKGHECCIYDEHLPRKEGIVAQKKVFDIIESWYRDHGKDVTLYKGVSFGSLLGMHFFKRIAILFRYIISFDNIIKAYRPRKIIAFLTERDERYAILAAIKDKYNFKPYRFDPLGKKVSRYSPSKFAKDESGFLNTIRKAVSVVYMLSSPIRKTSNRNKDVRLFLHCNVESLWSIWLNDKSIKNKIHLIFPDYSPPRNPFHFLKLLLSGCDVFTPANKALSGRDEQIVTTMQRSFDKLLEGGAWKGNFVWKGVDYSGIFADLFKSIFHKRVYLIAEKFEAYSKELKRLNPTYVLVKHDWPEDQQLIVELAKKQNIQTFVLMHGSPTFISPGNKIADNLITWGEGIKKTYVREKIKPKNIIVIGNPYFDKYLGTESRTQGNFVLVLQYPTAEQVVNAKEYSEEVYLIKVFEFLKRLGIRNVTLKLHPGRINKKYYEDLVGQYGIECNIVKNEDIKTLIMNSEYVIGPVTTAALETLILGKDYYCVHIDPWGLPPPFGEPYITTYRSLDRLESAVKKGAKLPRKKILKDFCNIRGGETYGHFARKVYEFFIGLNKRR